MAPGASGGASWESPECYPRRAVAPSSATELGPNDAKPGAPNAPGSYGHTVGGRRPWGVPIRRTAGTSAAGTLASGIILQVLDRVKEFHARSRQFSETRAIWSRRAMDGTMMARRRLAGLSRSRPGVGIAASATPAWAAGPAVRHRGGRHRRDAVRRRDAGRARQSSRPHQGTDGGAGATRRCHPGCRHGRRAGRADPGKAGRRRRGQRDAPGPARASAPRADRPGSRPERRRREAVRDRDGRLDAPIRRCRNRAVRGDRPAVRQGRRLRHSGRRLPARSSTSTAATRTWSACRCARCDECWSRSACSAPRPARWHRPVGPATSAPSPAQPTPQPDVQAPPAPVTRTRYQLGPLTVPSACSASSWR